MIATETSAISYSGNASTSLSYAIPFPMLETSHLKATVTDSAGTVTAFTDFSVVATKDGNGRITSATVTTGTAIPATSTVRFYRQTPAVQPLDLTSGGTLPAEATETALDRNTMIAQEARRDAAYSGTPEISVAGTGLVAQVAADSFAARTISPASGTPLSVTNGDGVSGNPTIALDSSGLAAASSVATSDVVLVYQSGAWKTATKAQIIATDAVTEYKTLSFRPGDITPATSNGCTITTASTNTQREPIANFAGGANAQTGFLRVFLPTDYVSGGDVLMRFHYLGVNSGSGVHDAVFQIAVHDQYDAAVYPRSYVFDTGASETKYVEAVPMKFSSLEYGDIGQSMNLGEMTGGGTFLVRIKRDPLDADDDSSAGGIDYDVAILGVEIQYPSQPATEAWS